MLGWLEYGAEKLKNLLPSWGSKKPYSSDDKFPNFINYTQTNAGLNIQTFRPPSIPVDDFGTEEETRVDEVRSKRPSGFAPGWNEKETGTSDTSGKHEANIVNNFTAKSGVKVIPTRQALQQFVNRCAKVNTDIIAELLNEKLESPAWQVRLVSNKILN